MTRIPTLEDQEIPLDHPDSCCRFQPGPQKPLVATEAAIAMYSHEVIYRCAEILRQRAAECDGLDYLQVFHDDTRPEKLWFIEDGEGGAITALLPSDY